MKKLILCAFAFVGTLAVFAQTPVEVQTKLITKSNEEAVLRFEMSIDKGWHVYSTNAGEGPISTELIVEEAVGCNTIGEFVAEGNEQEVYDKMFDTSVRYYEEIVYFEQPIRISSPDFKFSGYLTYSACNDESCTPPTSVNFSFGADTEKNKTVIEESDFNVVPISFADYETPNEKTLSNLTDNENLWQPATYEQANTTDNSLSLWIVFWSCFASGLLALLTPCVWPIIPMTVSFFLKRNENRKKSIRDSITYGFSIVAIYLSLGLLVSFFFDANQLNALATNAIVNIFFTALLLVFGFSFLGAFELKLPSSWSTSVNIKATSTSGILSIFLMAFTLVIVSFSCTGPIIGFLLVQVSTLGNIAAPAIGMLGFSLALALPFSFFALFPTLLNQLPRSGSWMNTLKVTLGFIEIAFALKFFSVADLAYGWHLLDREVFIAIWVSLAILLALYLLRIITFNGDGDTKKTNTLRCFGAIISISFALYLIPGLWGAPLKAVSGFVPPLSTQDFSLYTSMPHAKYHNYEQAMNYAQVNGKKVLVDFTGHGCVNCREMEQKLWTNPDVAQRIENEFVLVSLYVDDKTPLDNITEVIENGQTTVLRTVGDKWSYLQRYKFGVNAQPFYVILNPDGTMIGSACTFTTDVDEFMQFLSQ